MDSETKLIHELKQPLVRANTDLGKVVVELSAIVGAVLMGCGDITRAVFARSRNARSFLTKKPAPVTGRRHRVATPVGVSDRWYVLAASS
jgi:hypothetical protein